MSLVHPYSLYLHIPFCVHRCAYCDFNTYAGLETLIEPYAEMLCKEISLVGTEIKEPVQSIFLGGGTPSLLPPASLSAILKSLQTHFKVLENAEVTMEANPGTLSKEYLHEARSFGINRLSLGMQSANPDDLRILERHHRLQDVVQSVLWARQAGFDNINLDLIFGLPYQSLASWRGSLAMALSLVPEHLSLYSLTIEHGTPMNTWVNKGLISSPDEDNAAEMYEIATETLAKHGYTQYEISNWARDDSKGNLKSCRHNLQYWRSLPWLGFGAGAHGFVPSPTRDSHIRTINVLSPRQYIERLRDNAQEIKFPRTPATSSYTEIDRNELIGEYMMMGLRLTSEGISDSAFQARFGVTLDHQFSREISRLVKLGLLEWQPDQRLCLTKNGRLLGNRVFREFI